MASSIKYGVQTRLVVYRKPDVHTLDILTNVLERLSDAFNEIRE